LGITQSAIADAKRRGSFPKGWAVDISQAYNVSLNDLLKGNSQLSVDADRSVKTPTFGKEEEELIYQKKYEILMEKHIIVMEENSELRALLLEKPKAPAKKAQ
jgi:hypothetical protein